MLSYPLTLAGCLLAAEKGKLDAWLQAYLIHENNNVGLAKQLLERAAPARLQKMPLQHLGRIIEPEKGMKYVEVPEL